MSIMKCKKILEEISPLRLIREVKQWPILYDRSSPEWANYYMKLQTWNKVGQALFSDWDTYSDIEKESKVTDMTKKWRNLRDTFKRQIEIEKKMQEGYPLKKKRYVYFKAMNFLLPHFINPVDPQMICSDEETHRRIDIEPPNKKRRLNKGISDSEPIDEDKHFLMSLIPSFKRMTEDEKLTAKMEILQVIKNVKKHSVLGMPSNDFVEMTTTNAPLMAESMSTNVKVELDADGSVDNCSYGESD